MSQNGQERALIRADGSVHLRHTLSLDHAAEAFLDDGEGFVFAAVQYGIEVTERSFTIARFDENGQLERSAAGVLPPPSETIDRLYPPELRLEEGAVAFDQANGDSWLVDFDGGAVLRECEQRKSLGDAEEPGWVGALVDLVHGSSRAAFVDTVSGACRRLVNIESSAGTTLFLRGRFQYLRGDVVAPVLTDEGPATSTDFPLSARETGSSYAALYQTSEDVIYVLSAPELARYDVAAREFRLIQLPSPATSFTTHGDHVVGYDQGTPLWSYDVSSEVALEFEVEAEPMTVRIRSSDDFLLVSSDERPMTWLDIRTGESRPFEVGIPADAELEAIDAAAGGLVIADGVPVAWFDLEAGSAMPVKLARSGGGARTFQRGAHAVVVLDGMPAFRVDLESGSVDEVRDNASVGGDAATEQSGPHVVVSSAGRLAALLDEDSRELLSLDDPGGVSAALSLLANERYVVGFDERHWPVFRVDTSDRTLSPFAVSTPSDLVGFGDERYVEALGDELYEQNYARSGPAAAILDDGSVAVALRDARQGRLWVVAPSDTAFRPFGRPVTGVIALDFTTREYSFQVSGDRGDCYCQPPVLRWEEGGDADVLPAGSVQLVSRAHPELVIVRPYSLNKDDPSGVCVVETKSDETLVHDLLTGTSLRLENVEGAVSFLTRP